MVGVEVKASRVQGVQAHVIGAFETPFDQAPPWPWPTGGQNIMEHGMVPQKKVCGSWEGEILV
jgi:hypothetical protein